MEKPSYSRGVLVHYKSTHDDHDIVGEIEAAFVEDGIPLYGIHHPAFGYEVVPESRIYYKMDN